MQESISTDSTVHETRAWRAGVSQQLRALQGRLLVAITGEPAAGSEGTLLEFGLYVATGVGAAVLISMLHAQVNQQFLSMLERPEFALALAIYLLLGPSLWWLFFWQPRAVRAVVGSLQAVVSDADAHALLPDDFIAQSQIRPLRRLIGRAFVLAAIVALPLTVLFLVLSPILWRDDLVLFGVRPVALLPMWVAIIFVNLYFLTTVLIRHCVAIMSIGHIIRAFGVSPKAFHPDGCNGFGEVGEYATRTSLFALLYGLWVAIMLTSSVLRGQGNSVDLQALFMLGVYLSALAVLLVAPVWQTHVAMARAKRERLSTIASQIQVHLDPGIDPVSGPDTAEILTRLRDRYQLIDQAYRVWPLRVPAIRGLSIAAVVPLASTLISTLVKLVGPS